MKNAKWKRPTGRVRSRIHLDALHGPPNDAVPMAKRVVPESRRQFRRAGVAAPAPPRPLAERWYAKAGLLLLSTALLTFSFAPFGQFYLAWVGLVPWLLVVRRTRSQRAAFLWGWLGGLLFFTANMWWLAYVTAPGLIALMVVLALYSAVAAVVIRGAGLLKQEWSGGGGVQGWSGRDHASPAPPRHPTTPSRLFSLLPVLVLPAVWVSLEWLRGNWPLNGLPWLFLGHPQTPVLSMCQIADFAGVYGVSFWVVAVNTLAALFVIHRFQFRRIVPALLTVVVMLAATLAYGLWRMGQADALSPGPTVMVVQSNVPQSNTGDKGATYTELVDFHVSRTEEALRQRPDGGAGVDLVVWSETMMPELNRRARALFRGRPVGGHDDYGRFLDAVHARLKDLAYSHKINLLVGGHYLDVSAEDDPSAPDGVRLHQDRRNTAYFYDRTGHMSDDLADRYDKVHIVPFGEYLPFKHSLPILHKLFVALSPYEDDYFLTPGREDALTVFRVEPGPRLGQADSQPALQGRPLRFVTPICFEDIDPMLVARMFRSSGGKPGQVKEADLIVNITNDGWFKFNQMPQHLQAARFRSIENRAPTARSVNTGISGFVDSLGRVHGLIAAGREGVSVQSLPLDSRVTLYTRHGDVFACGCIAVALATVGAALWRRIPRARAQRATSSAQSP